MEAYTSNLGLLTTHSLTHSLTNSLAHLLICLHNVIVSHLKLVPGFRAFFSMSMPARRSP